MVHDMVSIALVDHDSKIACKSFMSTVVVRPGRINLKKIGEMMGKSMRAFGAILVDLEFPVDRVGRIASISADFLTRASLQLEDLDVILGDRLPGGPVLWLPLRSSYCSFSNISRSCSSCVLTVLWESRSRRSRPRRSQ